MAVPEVTAANNDTFFPDNEAEQSSGLTPRQIAGITIGTVFVFYLTLMLIVCVGEYCQYISGKKYKPELHRARSHPNHHNQNNGHKPKHSSTDPRSTKSEHRPATSSGQPRSPQMARPKSASDAGRRHNTTLSMAGTEVNSNKRGSFDGSLNRLKVGADCLQPCDSPILKSNMKNKDGVIMVPLIEKQCEDLGYDKTDMLSGTFEGGSDYSNLEANV